MRLSKLKSDYEKGIISKPEYIKEMHKMHKCLFEYSEFIKDTDSSSIEITDDSVLMTCRSTGVKMLCDKTDERIVPIEILNFGFYEKTDFDMALKLIEENFIVFDIGANIGWYTINISKLVEGVKVFSFEPIPKTLRYLKKNIEINNISNVQVFNFGFSNEEKEITFYYYPEGSGNASLANLSKSNNVEKISCYVRKMDNFVSEKKIKVDFIKCDVEGAELFVFKGGIETIKTHKPIILAEMLRKWSANFNYHPNEIIELLSDVGYRCFTAKGEKLIEFFTMDEQTVETTFFFLHSVKHISKINSLLENTALLPKLGEEHDKNYYGGR
jgi:FkbM family methyltransferase